MEEQWQIDRARLRTLHQQHPDWSYPHLAQHLSRSISWVKKWSKRLKTAGPEDQTVLKSQSRCPKHPPPSIEPVVVERILDEHQRIIRPTQSEREPTPQAEPLQVWQIDFKDVCAVERP